MNGNYNALTPTNNRAAALIRAAENESTGSLGKLLKFSKGHYLGGSDEVPVGTEYIAHVTQWAIGWVKFAGGRLVEKRIGRVADDFVVAQRDSLDDRHLAGTQDDPWSRQAYLPFEHTESGEIVIFVTGSAGGRNAIADVCRVAAKHLDRGNPIIRLNVTSYRHPEYGRIEKPVFDIVGYTEVAHDKPAINVFDDDVPF
jgi:hypothetical protein